MNHDSRYSPFVIGYVTAALWSTPDDRPGDHPEMLDGTFSIEDIAPEAMASIIGDCEEFVEQNNATLYEAFAHPDYKRIPDSTPEQTAGHDFWMTRNGHGVGFWDGDYPKEHGEKLTEACEKYGECDLYVGDDGKLYVSPVRGWVQI